MSQSIYSKVWLRTTKERLDISESIESIRHETDREKGALIEFKTNSNRALDLANHPDMVAGAIIDYDYGFMRSLNQTDHKLCRVGNITYDLSQNRVQLLIQGVDKSLEIKKSQSYKIWKKVTLSDIAKAIAEDYGLTFRGETTKKVYDSIPQSGRSDWQFLEYIKLLESENYYLSVDESFLMLEKNLRSKYSAISYTFGENIMSIRIELKEISQKQPVTANLGIDDKTGKPYPVDKSLSNDEKEKTDGKFSLNAISKAAVSGRKKIFDFDINAKKIDEHIESFLGAGDPTENKNKASHINRANTEKTLTCDILVDLDVHRKAGEVVTLWLPIDKLSGNYLVEKCVHRIEKSGGFTELSLSKTGTSRPVKAVKEANPEKVNTTEGPSKSVPKRRIFNINGKEIK